MSLPVLLAIYAAAIGAIVGSYLNVVIYRIPAGISTVVPRSRCPHCGAAIRARDNVPLLGFLLLGGRCRDCGEPISRRYPLVEAASMALFAGAAYRFGLSIEAVAAIALGSLLLVLGGIDFEHYYLPDRLTLPGIVAGLIAQMLSPSGSLATGLEGAMLGGGILLAMAGLWKLARGEEGMGLGDVKMLAMIGAFLGPSGVIVALVFGAAAGSVLGLALIARGSGSMKTRLPFGVFLAAGGFVAIFAGGPLTRYYLGLL